MIDVWAALETAELGYIVGLSLTVSFLGTAVAAAVGLPSGAAFAISRFPGRRLLILLANAFLGLPPVVVGLGLYLMLSRRAESRPECLDPNWRRCAVPASVALRSRSRRFNVAQTGQTRDPAPKLPEIWRMSGYAFLALTEERRS